MNRFSTLSAVLAVSLLLSSCGSKGSDDSSFVMPEIGGSAVTTTSYKSNVIRDTDTVLDNETTTTTVTTIRERETTTRDTGATTWSSILHEVNDEVLAETESEAVNADTEVSSLNDGNMVDFTLSDDKAEMDRQLDVLVRITNLAIERAQQNNADLSDYYEGRTIYIGVIVDNLFDSIFINDMMTNSIDYGTLTLKLTKDNKIKSLKFISDRYGDDLAVEYKPSNKDKKD